jgi:hypothetical protein
VVLAAPQAAGAPAVPAGPGLPLALAVRAALAAVPAGLVPVLRVLAAASAPLEVIAVP